MAITFVQGNVASTSGSPFNPAYSSNNAAGNLLVFATRSNQNSSTVTGITDSNGNTWQQAVPTQNNLASLSVWYAANCGAGANTLTVTASGTATNLSMLLEYSGLATSAPLDKDSGATGSSTAPNSGNITTTQANELLFGAVDQNSNISSFGTGWTQRVAGGSAFIAVADNVVSSTGTYAFAPTFSSTLQWECSIASFKAPASGGSGSVRWVNRHRHFVDKR